MSHTFTQISYLSIENILTFYSKQSYDILPKKDWNMLNKGAQIISKGKEKKTKTKIAFAFHFSDVETVDCDIFITHFISFDCNE